MYTLDLKEVGMKDAKISCLEFRDAVNPSDKSSFLWVGTKEGNLCEIDIRAKVAEHLKPCQARTPRHQEVLTRTSSSFPFNAATCNAVFPSTFAQSRISG